MKIWPLYWNGARVPIKVIMCSRWVKQTRVTGTFKERILIFPAQNLGLLSHKQVSRARTSNTTPWDVITCPCPRYLLLAHKFTIHRVHRKILCSPGDAVVSFIWCAHSIIDIFLPTVWFMVNLCVTLTWWYERKLNVFEFNVLRPTWIWPAKEVGR